MAEIVERVREHIKAAEHDHGADRAGNYISDASIDDLRALLAAIEHRDARIAKLEARLEIDHEWVSKDGGPLERVDIPPEKRDEQYDGIFCRDETIRLQDENIERLRAAIEQRDQIIAGLKEEVAALSGVGDRDYDRSVSANLLESLSEASRCSGTVTLDHSACADLWGEIVRLRGKIFHQTRALSEAASKARAVMEGK